MATMGHNQPPADAPFAIYRHEKLKTSAAIGKSARHMTREAPTPNADPARAHLNRVLIGTDDPAADAEALIPALGARDEQGKLRRRSNSVLAIEVLLSASPEWWEIATPEQQQEWVDRTTEWLIAEYGRENIAHLRIHADERSPHITGFVVPLDENGHLNARAWIGGADRCAQQQTDYAQAVEHLGLRRGIEGSTAKHEAVRRHYAQIQQPVAKLKIDRPPRILLDPEGWAAEQRNNLRKQAGPAFARARVADSERTKRRAAEAQAAKDRGRADRAQEALDAQKAAAARLRALPLAEVLDALGFQEDARERGRWRAEGFNITLGTGAKAGKWFDHTAGQGRGGAIDLVQHAMGTDFKSALAWLSDRFGPGPTAADLTARLRAQAVAQVREAQAEREPFTPPQPAPENWPKVRRYLTADRALPAAYIDRLHELGDCYADARGHAVFVCRDEDGQAVGAELKGTVPRPDGSRFTGMAPGSRKDRGGFRVGAVARAAVVYLVESAIDAISLTRLRQMDGETGFAVVSTAGTTPEPRRWFAGLADAVRRVCAFDNDPVGDKAAQALRRHRFERLRPEGKDWNDDLKARVRAAGGQGGTPTAKMVLRPQGSQPSSPRETGPGTEGPGF